VPSKQDLIEELRDYYEQFANIKEDAQELTAVLTGPQFNWRPSPKQWSICECLTHLNVTDERDLPAMDSEIDRGRAAGITGHGPFQYSFMSRRMVRSMEPPPKFRFKAPKVFLPVSDQPKDKVMAEFLSIHDRMMELVTKSNGLDLAKITVPSPIKLIRFSLGQRFALLAAHDRRHLYQAWAVRKHRNFPLYSEPRP